MKIYLAIIFVLLWNHTSHSQNPRLIDSLENSLKNHQAYRLELGKNASPLFDTTAAEIFVQLSKAYWRSNPDKAMEYAEQALSLSERIGYKKGIATAYNSLGAIRNYKSEYSAAIEFYKKSLQIREETGDKAGIAASYNNLGSVSAQQGNYPDALKYMLSGLKIREEMRDSLGMASLYLNMGQVYSFMNNNPEALANYNASLKIYGETGDKSGISGAYNNIGSTYMKQGNYTEALKNHLASLKLKEEIGDKSGIADSYGNIGVIYSKQGNYPEALKNFFAVLKIKEEVGDKSGIARTYNQIGNNYTKLKNFNEAAIYLNKGLVLAKEIGSLQQIQNSYGALAVMDSTAGNFKSALANYQMFVTTHESLVNTENEKKIMQQQMQYEFDKKESLAKAEQEKKNFISQKELQKQKLVRNGFVGGFAVVLFFAGVFFTQRNKISKAKKISEAEKERSEELLLNILPSEVAEELKQSGKCQPRTYSMVTVMFADFKDFTSVSEKVSGELLVNEINFCFSAFDQIIQKHKIEKIKTVGDAYMCAGGLPSLNYTHAFDVTAAALEMNHFILHRKKEKESKNEIAFELRIGIHTGPVVAGIVGIKKFSYDIWGDTVNLAARMEQSCEAGHVNISGITYELVKDKFSCVHRGKIQAKNKGELDMYFVERPI